MAQARRYADAGEWTCADYARLPADGRRYELHEGVLWMAPGPIAQHQRIVGRLHWLLFQQAKRGRLGEVFIAPYGVVPSAISVVQPDLVFVAEANAGIVTEDNIRGAPDLLVEVVSPGTRRIDRVYKRGLYERSGVREYWIVDGEAREVTVCVLERGRRRFGRRRTYRDDDTLRSGATPSPEVVLS